MLEQILILLAASVIAVTLFRRANLPPILGYLFVGVVVGPYGMAWIPDTADIRFLAEFGVAFLLFTLGLEFSLPQLVSMRRAVLGLGGAQVLLSTVFIATAAWLLGVPVEIAIVLGGALAMSSTAIVIKQLADQGELTLPHGRLAVGVLLFQDVAFIPFLVLIAALSGSGTDNLTMELAWALAKGVFAFVVMLAAGHWLLRPMFHEIVRARSPELFTLTVLLVTITAAWLTHEAGLSLALGAFLAGMMLGETEFRHQVEADIRPFRDILLGLFFITVGMMLDIDALPSILHWVVLATLGLVAFKLVTITLLARKLCTEWHTSARTGIVLAQGGEFGLAVALLAVSSGLLSGFQAQVVLGTVIISMALAPALIRFNAPLSRMLFGNAERTEQIELEHEIAHHPGGSTGHVLLVGFGRVGQNVARFIEEEGIDYVALDLDPVRIRKAREAGDPVYFGDATRWEVLRSADVQHARAVVITYWDTSISLRIIRQIREAGIDVPILVRTRDDSNLELLQEAGATEVIPETLEASMMVVSHLLALMKVPVKRIVRRIQEVRNDRYALMRTVFRGQDTPTLDVTRSFREQLYSVHLTADSHASGRRIHELGLEKYGVMVTALRRDNIVGKQPDPDTELRPDDVLVLYGTPEDLEHAEEVITRG